MHHPLRLFIFKHKLLFHLVEQYELVISQIVLETEGLHPLMDASTVGPGDLVVVLVLCLSGQVVSQIHLHIHESALCLPYHSGLVFF